MRRVLTMAEKGGCEFFSLIFITYAMALILLYVLVHTAGTFTPAFEVFALVHDVHHDLVCCKIGGCVNVPHQSTLQFVASVLEQIIRLAKGY